MLTPLYVYSFFRQLIPLHASRIAMAWKGDCPTCAIRSTTSTPVLYLRSFSHDRTMSKPAWRTLLWSYVFGGFPLSTEASLCRRLSRLGPVLAIGRPREGSPPPGALRLYVKDQHWRSVVSNLASHSQLVVFLLGEGDGLEWELRHIFETVPKQNIILIGTSAQSASLACIPVDAQRLMKTKGVHFVTFDRQGLAKSIPPQPGRSISLIERISTPKKLTGLNDYLAERGARVKIGLLNLIAPALFALWSVTFWWVNAQGLYDQWVYETTETFEAVPDLDQASYDAYMASLRNNSEDVATEDPLAGNERQQK